MTRKGYNIPLLIETIKRLRQRHPNLQVILEPGSAFLWQTGYLTSKVVDIVENGGIKTAILNVSFTCHMPDCLEMPYQPEVRDAVILKDYGEAEQTSDNVYRLGGNSCLSGDYIGYWNFGKQLHIGDDVILEDMIHYTTVKTNMFNGINHPSIALKKTDGEMVLLREYSYNDYKQRMD
jgi:carboxynorspermidine decarboxylase